MENKHKHYDMIVAKAANTELIKFYKHSETGVWIECANQEIVFYDKYDYFLCLPQHKEEVLHALNGGEIQYKGGVHWVECFVSYDMSNVKWRNNWWYMDKGTQTRIKPKKEKRWIAVNTKSNQVSEMFINAIECEVETVNAYMLQDGHEWQFIEIEVEV